MDHTKPIITLFALIAIALFAASGCRHTNKNPLDYNNNLMSALNKNPRDMQAMNAAMTSGDYTKAAEVRKNWVNHLEVALKKVYSLGGFNGDYSFQKVVIKGLKSYNRVVTIDYKELITIRSKGNKTQQARESELLNTINKTFIHAENAINKAAVAFQKKYATSRAFINRG